MRATALFLIKVLTIGTLLTGCQRINRAWSAIAMESEIDSPQGMQTTIEVTQIKKGMSKQQVQQIIGQPTIIHALNPDEWTYISINHNQVEQRLMLTFANEKLISITEEKS